MKVELKYCPSILLRGFETYSPLAQRDLFGTWHPVISHILEFGASGKDDSIMGEYNENRKFIRISGVQKKYSLQRGKTPYTGR